MSTDFKGNNESITADDLYLSLSDCLGKCLNVPREKVYGHYTAIGKCEGHGSWPHYARYNVRCGSNDYVGDAFDNLVILREAVGKEELLSRDIGTAQARRDRLTADCAPLIQDGLCDGFTISGLFPHLDVPGAVVDIRGVSGVIPCVDPSPRKYETLYAMVSYTDSCGCGLQEPVPYYPAEWDSDPSKEIFLKSTLDDAKFGVSAEYRWGITKNADSVAVSDDTAGMDGPCVRIGTLSSAIDPGVTVTFSYSEAH